jgi:hypothetical protein
MRRYGKVEDFCLTREPEIMSCLSRDFVGDISQKVLQYHVWLFISDPQDVESQSSNQSI